MEDKENKIDIELCNRLIEVRKYLDISMSEFSRLVETKPNVIHDIEHYKREPSKKIISLLITKCKINANWLLTGNGEMHIQNIFTTEKPKFPPNVAKSNNKELNICIEELYESPSLTRALAVFFRNKKKGAEALDNLANSISLSSEVLKHTQS